MKDNKNPSILNKKKYLAFLPFTLLGASAFISNSAQAALNCDTTNDTDSVSMTCTDHGAESLDTINLETDKKNLDFSLDTTNNAILTSKTNQLDGAINLKSTYEGDEVGSIHIDLKKSGVIELETTRPSERIIDVEAKNSNIELNLNHNVKKLYKPFSNSLYHGAIINISGNGTQNNVTIDSTISAAYNSIHHNNNGAINNNIISKKARNTEQYTTLNKNANINITSNRSAYGVQVNSAAYNLDENVNITASSTLNMNGGEISISAANTIGINTSIESETAFVPAIELENNKESISNINLNAGKIYTQSSNFITTSNLRRFSNFSIGIRSFADKTILNQKAKHSIYSYGSNSSSLFITSKEAYLNLEGTLVSANNIIKIDPLNYGEKSNSTINIADSAVLRAGNGNKGEFILNDSDGVSHTTIGKADITGSFYLAGGDDTLTFNDTDLSNLGNINGGLGADKVTFNNYTHEEFLEASQLDSIEFLNINNSTFNINGKRLEVGSGTINGEAAGLFLNNSTLKLNSEANDRRSAEENFTLTGDLHNLEGSIIDLRNDTNPDYFNTLTVNGDYYGGGTLIFNSKAGDDGSHSDKIVLNGDVHGSTKLVVNNKGGLGDQTADGIKVVEIADSSTVDEGGNAFVLAHSVEAGAYEYNELSYTDTNGKKGFYLQSNSTGGKGSSKGNGSTGSNSSSGSVERGDSTIIDKDGRKVHLLRPAAAAYVLNQQINAQALADLNAGLHQRSGEQRAETNYLNQNQSWVRTIGTRTKVDANNLGSTNNHFGLQVGYDFKTTHQDDFRNRAGVFASYSKVNTTLTDSHRREFYIPSKVDTHLATLALYNTSNFGNGYVDLVGGLHFLHSDYEIFNGGEQNAFGANLSVEAGYNLDLGNHFFVEPQVQLSYQGTRYAGFKDAVTAVKGYTHQSLRPRAGFRLGYHDVAGTNLWLHANLETELLKTAKVTIGSNVESVDRAAKVAYDLGLNGQVALNSTTVLYGSAQYKGAVGQSETLKSGAKVKATKLSGFGAEAGLRFTW